MNPWSAFSLLPVVIVAPQTAYAEQYLTAEQAREAMFPGIPFKGSTARLTEEQKRAIEKRTGVRVRNVELTLWRAPDGALFMVDEVLGKHEFITYAVGIDANGGVKGIEILEYRESYGYEVRRAEWRAQFHGKTAQAPLELDRDIRNISGATLSSKHIIEGVRRLLATYELALR